MSLYAKYTMNFMIHHNQITFVISSVELVGFCVFKRKDDVSLAVLIEFASCVKHSDGFPSSDLTSILEVESKRDIDLVKRVHLFDSA